MEIHRRHSLPGEIASLLLPHAVDRRYAPGQLVYASGDEAGAIYVVRTGRVRFSTLLPDGTQTELEEIRPGDWFGEVALLGDMPRLVDAHAVDDSVIGQVSKLSINRLMVERPELARALVSLLARHLAIALETLDDLRTLPTGELVMKRLRLLCDDGGMARVDQATLGSLLGLSRVTVGKALRRLAAQGRLVLGYGRIELVSAAEPISKREKYPSR